MEVGLHPLVLVAAIIAIIGVSNVSGVQGQCANICWDDVCEFHLTLTFGKTVDIQGSDGGHDGGHNIHSSNIPQVPLSGEGCPRSGHEDPPPLTGDGRERRVLLVNGQFPGPTLQVKEGAQVIVRVASRLQSLSTVLHFHGMHMFGTQWMDGVPYVTQCPIPPSQTFTYNFTATPPGTHWYHPHLLNHRQDGLYGLFIVHKTRPSLTEFPLLISDWKENDGVADIMTDLRRNVYGQYTNPVSSLINGRGRHTTKPSSPLSSFHLQKDKIYKFRTVNAAANTGYEISVDGHLLTVVAWDGGDIEPIAVHGLNIFPGESIDFTINTTNHASESFWLRARSLTMHEASHMAGMTDEPTGDHNVHDSMKMLEVNHDEHNITTKPSPHTTPSSNEGGHGGHSGTNPLDGAAILHFGDHAANPEDIPHHCNNHKKCIIFNCYKHYGHEEYKECIQLESIQASYSRDTSYFVDPGLLATKEYFLNVGIISGATISGKEFVSPLSPFYQRFNPYEVDCDTVCRDPTKGCACTHTLTLPYKKLIQLVVSNIEPEGSASTSQTSSHSGHTIGHPIHIHGTRFAVIEQGLGGVPHEGSEKPSNNPDIQCDTDLCRYPRWSQQKSSKVSPVGDRPPTKDTIIVPPGGYVVLRMYTDNPGYWLVHCHVMRDQLDGMAMLLKVAPEKVPTAPVDQPVCHPQAFQCANNRCGDNPEVQENTEGVTTWTSAQMALISMSFLGAGLLIGALVAICCNRRKKKASYVTNFPQQLLSYTSGMPSSYTNPIGTWSST